MHEIRIEKDNNIKQLKMIAAQRQEKLEELETKLSLLQDQVEDYESEKNTINNYQYYYNDDYEPSRGYLRYMTVEVTAYDLSVQSCGKSLDHPGYGVTASGFNLSDHTLESARAIAVDPDIIPLGSKVHIKFKSPHLRKLNGVYNAVDTGGDIQGNRIDLFFGDYKSNYPSQEAMDFGRQEAKIAIVY